MPKGPRSNEQRMRKKTKILQQRLRLVLRRLDSVRGNVLYGSRSGSGCRSLLRIRSSLLLILTN